MRFPHEKSLAAAAEARRNSIGFLRFVFAAMVLWSHSFVLGGFGPEPMMGFTEGRQTLGTLAVQCFFVLSGFLIPSSYARSSSVLRFLWHRLLRILPGFWVCLLVTALVFGPLHFFTINGNLDFYFSTPALGPWQYVLGNAQLAMSQYSIFSMPLNVPYPHVFDGALWSIIYEWHCYVCVAALGLIGAWRRIPLLGVLASVALIAMPLIPSALPWLAHLPYMEDGYMLSLVPYFFAGALVFVARRFIILDRAIFVVACVAVAVSLRWVPWIPVRPLALTYVVFWLGHRLPFVHFDARGDLSYGFYIYAFPVQQTVALWGGTRFGVVVYALISAVVTLGLAWLSYHLVEKRFLRLKDLRIPLPRALSEQLRLRIPAVANRMTRVSSTPSAQPTASAAPSLDQR